MRRGTFGFVGVLNGAFCSRIVRGQRSIVLIGGVFPFPSELRVALPDRAPILIGAVPDLAAENTAAGEWLDAALLSAASSLPIVEDASPEKS